MLNQGCGFVFISSGSGSSILGWTPIQIRIRIQSGSRALMTKNCKKITAEKFFFSFKNCNLPIPRPFIKYVQVIEEAFSSQKRPSNTSKHELFFYFCGSFLPSWIRIRIPNPDPQARLNPDPIRIRIRNPGLDCWRKKFGPIFKELWNFLCKKIVIKLSKIWFWDPGSRGQKGPGSGSATLL